MDSVRMKCINLCKARVSTTQELAIIIIIARFPLILCAISHSGIALQDYVSQAGTD